MRSPVFDIRKGSVACTTPGRFDTGVSKGAEDIAARYCANSSCYKKLSKYNHEKYCFACMDTRIEKESEALIAATVEEKEKKAKPPAKPKPSLKPVPMPPEAKPSVPLVARKYKAWVRMIDVLGDHGPLTAGQALRILKISVPTAHNSVKLLKGEGLIRQTGIVSRGKRTARVYGLTVRGRAIYNLEEEPPKLVLTRAAK